MDNLQMDEMLARLRQHKRTIAELKQAAEAIEAEIKAELTARGVDVLETPHYKVSWKITSSTRLDVKALKEERPEIYARYAVASASKRFVIT